MATAPFCSNKHSFERRLLYPFTPSRTSPSSLVLSHTAARVCGYTQVRRQYIPGFPSSLRCRYSPFVRRCTCAKVWHSTTAGSQCSSGVIQYKKKTKGIQRERALEAASSSIHLQSKFSHLRGKCPEGWRASRGKRVALRGHRSIVLRARTVGGGAIPIPTTAGASAWTVTSTMHLHVHGGRYQRKGRLVGAADERVREGGVGIVPVEHPVPVTPAERKPFEIIGAAAAVAGVLRGRDGAHRLVQKARVHVANVPRALHCRHKRGLDIFLQQGLPVHPLEEGVVLHSRSSIGSTAQPLLRLPHQQPRQKVGSLVTHELRNPQPRVQDHLVHLLHVSAVERRPAHDHLVQQCAKAPPVHGFPMASA
eukprot:RCo027408